MLTGAVLRYLTSLGLVLYDAPGADAFLERAPDDASPSVACVSGYGLQAIVWDSYDVGDFQIICRDGPSARNALERSRDIRAALNGLRYATLAPATADEVRVQALLSKHDTPVPLGVDEGGKYRYSVGYRAKYKAPTALRP